MADVLTVIDGMSWWVKGAWLVWLAWVGSQVAWYRWGRVQTPEPARSAPPERPAASRQAAVDTTRHPAAAVVDPRPSGHHHRRRRRPRPEPAATTDLTEGVEAAR
jgi:hypothetical protein